MSKEVWFQSDFVSELAALCNPFEGVGENGSSSLGPLGDEIGRVGCGERLGGVKSTGFEPFILGMTIVKSSAAFVGLIWGWVTSKGRAPLGNPNLLKEGFPLPGLLAAGLSGFGDASLVVLAFGAGVLTLFTGLPAGLRGGVSVLVDFRMAWGSAVGGLARSGLRRGRTGAEDKLPTEVVDALREAVDIAVAGLAMFICEADFLGDPKGSADPDREGRFLPAALAAFF